MYNSFKSLRSAVPRGIACLLAAMACSTHSTANDGTINATVKAGQDVGIAFGPSMAARSATFSPEGGVFDVSGDPESPR